MLIDCSILCHSVKDVERGLPEKNAWCPFCFDMREVESVKASLDDDLHIVNEESIIYFKNYSMITNIPYQVLLQAFKDSRATTFPMAQLSQH